MKIGIVGSGNIGSNLARLFVKAGHEVVLSWSRSPEKLIALSLSLGNKNTARAASVQEAVQEVDLSILSIRFSILNEVRAQMGNLHGKIIVDTNNQYDIQLPEGSSAAAEIQRRLPGIRLVKAFNTLYYTSLISESFRDPLAVMPVCSDDQPAKQSVIELIHDIGFHPFDLGGLSYVQLQEIGGPFYNKLMTAQDAIALKKT